MGRTNVSDYAMIKNGSYGKLMKAYFAKQDADKLSQNQSTIDERVAVKTRIQMR
ncbi:MAG: hypothetical protein K1W36_04230 [Lachnospiraceae bacterium]